MEAGNFAAPSKVGGDRAKTQAFLDFYRLDHYDAIALSSRELALGMDLWSKAKTQGFPILAANLFTDKKGKKPAFEQFLVKKDKKNRLGVIGFVTSSAWKAMKDTTVTLTFKSPFECKKLIKKAAHRSDHLTVLGEFTRAEAESLIHVYPQINLVVTSGADNSGQSIPVGKSLIVGTQAKGNFGNYVDWTLARPDTSNPFLVSSEALDGTRGEDTLVTNLISAANELIRSGGSK